MFSTAIRRTLFARTLKFRAPGKSAPRDRTTVISQFVEPSPEIRAAVRRFRLGLPLQSNGKPKAPWHQPVAYEAMPVHKRALARGGLASSEALIITRFQLSRADDEMSRLLGRETEGMSVLELDLSGLELVWHKDLIRALEDRAAVWSVSALIEPSGDQVIEHVVVPARSGDGQLLLVGWFYRVDGRLPGYPTWTNIIDFRRERPGQRISDSLAEIGGPASVSGPERLAPTDRVSESQGIGAT